MDELDIKPHIRPKKVTEKYEGHSYVCIFDVNAPPMNRWFFVATYTRAYPIHGSAPTLAMAHARARKSIRTMKKDLE